MTSPDRDGVENMTGPLGEVLIDVSGEMSVTARLTAQIDTLVAQHKEYIDSTGQLELGTFNGDTITIQRHELPPTSYMSSNRIATGGLTGFMKRRFAKPLTSASTHYSIKLECNDETLNLHLTNQSGDENVMSASGDRTMITDDSQTYTTLRAGLDLEEALERAGTALADSLPFSAEAAIKQRQNRSCHTIIGQEAMDLQSTVDSFITATGLTDLGNRQGDENVITHEPIEPSTDSRWVVQEIITIAQAGNVTPRIAGPDGRTVTSMILFFDSTDDTPLVIRAEGVYGSDDRLVNSQVSYSHRAANASFPPVAMEPADRIAIHTAIADQLVPGKLF